MFGLGDGESTRASLSDALERSARTLAVFGADGRLRFCSEGYRRAIASLAEPEHARADYPRVFQCVLRFVSPGPGEPVSASFAFQRELDVDLALNDGRALRWSQHPLPDGGLFVQMLDRTEDEQRLQRLRDSVREARARQQATATLLRSLSRELCSQLNAVLGFVQLMMRDRGEPLSARNRARADDAYRGGRVLVRLLTAADELARLGLEQVGPPSDEVDVLGLVDRVRASLAPLALRIGVTIDVQSYHVGQLPKVRAAPAHLSHILMNLGANAIEYNRPDGTVIFKVSMPRAGIVRINVVDTGPGIDREHHAKLFQPFYRAGQTSGDGAGLGLVIAQRLSETIGGRVGFESTVGVGSEFWLDVPCS